MLHRTPVMRRSAVAFFNMKSFHGRYKTPVDPTTVREIFGTQVVPNDRLLQQSRAGAGAARVLLINHRQMVKGVYSPLLCLPHPTLVTGGDSPLGVSVEAYLAAIGPAPETGKAAKRAKREGPSVMVAVSHPNGLAVGGFTGDGAPQFPVRNISFEPLTAPIAADAEEAATPASPAHTPRSVDGLGAAAAEVTAHVQIPDAVLDEFLDTLNTLYAKHLVNASTLYFVTHDSASITLASLRDAFKARQEAGTAPSASLALDDRRWVPMPELALQGGHPTAPLYARDSTTRSKIVNPAGLAAAVSRGQLELDYVPQDRNEVKAGAAKA